VPALGIDIGGSSVKIALVHGADMTTSRSAGYERPSREALVGAVQGAIRLLGEPIGSATPVGLCMPGKHDVSGRCVCRSVNMTCLEGWAFEDMAREMLGFAPDAMRVSSDIHATAMDLVRCFELDKRTAVLAIGTGVGLALVEDGESLSIGSKGIGHLGQLDVGRCGSADRFTREGTRNTLESYVGAGALRERFGMDEEGLVREIGRVADDDPFVVALVRALRAVHAIYAPEAVVLAGGVGMALAPRREELYRLVCDGLTSLACSDWELRFGMSLFHAASGAACLAAR